MLSVAYCPSSLIRFIVQKRMRNMRGIEMALLASIFVQLGDTLAIIAAREKDTEMFSYFS